jgi:hypothetical protein
MGMSRLNWFDSMGISVETAGETTTTSSAMQARGLRAEIRLTTSVNLGGLAFNFSCISHEQGVISHWTCIREMP